MTIYWPDVSNNNWASVDDAINFVSQLAGEGFAAVAHKVSEGSYYRDPYWQPVSQWCAANGLTCFGYHYVTTDPPAAQAAMWTGNAGGPIAMFDWEANGGDLGNFWAVANAFNAAGVTVQVGYCPQWYWSEVGGGDLSPIPFLVSSAYPGGSGYASDIYAQDGGDSGEGWTPYGNATPLGWQFTDQALVAGKLVDCNAFRGTLTQFRQALGLVPPSNPPAIPQPTDEAAQVAQVWGQLLTRWDFLNGNTPVEAVGVIGEALKVQGYRNP